jgi:hypothetical protein
MKRFCTGFAGLLLFPAAAAADGATADGASSGCGGDAYSFGEVVPPNRAGQEGPIIVVPDTLCPDVVGGQGTSIQSLSIYVDGRREGAVQHPGMRRRHPHEAPHPRY